MITAASVSPTSSPSNARSLVSILMGEGNREFFWRIAVVVFLVVVLSAGGRLDPAELFAGMAVGQDTALLAEWIDKGAQWLAIGDDYSLMIRTAIQVADSVRNHASSIQHGLVSPNRG